ncbi:MAG: glycosyltransferase family 1 protein [Roseibium sp.]|uniref:glycosyltransferase n=1 Tax=Roseibium sp. TaxID=1936156 RepID=UPI001B1F58F9|nr:glycosyltransferase [Roseibium sp.]MBO6892378.1 glycosyltransferase family 1 protein [Roseibium sp.]
MSDKAPKILIATLGTRGDVQPYVALAKALCERGATVTVSTGEGFETMIEKAGARARPVPIDFKNLLQSEDVQNALHSLRGMIKAARKNMALQKDIARALWEIGLEEKPDLILFNLKATVMTFVGRRLNIPAIPTSLQPVMAPTTEFPLPLFGLPDLGPRMNRWSYTIGHALMRFGTGKLAKPLKDVAGAEISQPGDQMFGFLPDGGKTPILQAFSQALVPTPADWPEQNWSCGYWLTDPETDFEAPFDLLAFLDAGSPPVYLGFGSMTSQDPEGLSRTVLAALETTGQRAILATGWGGLSKQPLTGKLTNQVHLLERAPHSWLFPKCAAVVHHGGAGTTHEAVRWGVPSLVTPVFGDQPFWGARIHAIGAGPAPIRQKKLTPDTLASALRDLERPDYKAGAKKAADLIASEPGARGTAEKLLRYLGDQCG